MSSVVQRLRFVAQALVAAVARLDKSFSPSLTLSRLGSYHFTLSDSIYVFHVLLATFWLTLMQMPPFPYKLLIPILYAIALLIPFTSQFFIPATPVFAWLLTFYSNRFIPSSWRPSISVSLLPTLESVLYGANVSDILTRVTHPIFDIIAWIPYGVVHYTFPFVLAAFIWLFRAQPALRLWAKVFGYMNLIGVLTQIIMPCAAPWYELIYGLTPANYDIRGSPGGLARIDNLFGTHGYTATFGNSPLVFGAFPSLHAAWATLEALFVSHFFPRAAKAMWAYTAVLYWATMYLTHHYLVDVVGGACLATACFFLFLPDSLRGSIALQRPANLPQAQRSKYEEYDLEAPRRQNGGLEAGDLELSEEGSSDEGEVDITYRSPAARSFIPNGYHPEARSVTPADAGARKNEGGRKKSHRHTASIASLIRSEERAPEDGWSPVVGGFALSPARERA